MIRSMFTAINALHTQQTFMDVVADNLANVNTPGFKASYVTFKDQFAQLIAAGAAPTETLGGVNPTQIGLGVRLGVVNQTFTQGALQFTGRDLDLCVQGDGFFIYTNGMRTFYSRDGSVAMDATGYLVNTGTGDRLLGWSPKADGTIDTGEPLGGIKIPVDNTIARVTSVCHLIGNLNSETPPMTADAHFITMGVHDALGNLHSVTLTLSRDAVNPGPPPTSTWTWVASGDVTGGNGEVVFDENGQFVSVNVINPVEVIGSPGTPNFVVDMNMSGVTMLADANTATLSSQDGLSAGTLVGFNIASNNGEIYGVYSNGDQKLLGQIAMALFVNPAGLIRFGADRYVVGLNSGEPRVGAGGAGGRGQVVSGYTEGSNVDMSREFANMILAQRGFQASSRIISASDEMLQELVNIRR